MRHNLLPEINAFQRVTKLSDNKVSMLISNGGSLVRDLRLTGRKCGDRLARQARQAMEEYLGAC